MWDLLFGSDDRDGVLGKGGGRLALLGCAGLVAEFAERSPVFIPFLAKDQILQNSPHKRREMALGGRVWYQNAHTLLIRA